MNNSKTIGYCILIGILALYSITSFLTGDLTPLYISLAVILFLTAPYWGVLSLLGVILFQFSSFQIPVGPKPDLWQIFGLLAAPGLAVTVMRGLAVRNRVLSPSLYAAILLVAIMLGMNALFNAPGLKSIVSNVGGRMYLESILLLFLPIAAAHIRIKNVNLEKWIAVSFLLSITYAIMELTIRYAPSVAGLLYPFMDIINDTLNFAGASEHWGYDRLAGVGQFILYLACFLVCIHPVGRNIKTVHKYVFLLIILACFAGSLISGYRRFVGYPIIIIPIYLYFERSINVKTIAFFSSVILLAGTIILINFERIPPSYQRAMLIIPGIEKVLGESQAYSQFGDAYANEGGRAKIRHASYRIIDEGLTLIGEGWYQLPGVHEAVDGIDSSMLQRRYPIGGLSPIITLGVIGFMITSLYTLCLVLYLVKFFKYCYRHHSQTMATRVASCISGVLIYYILYYHIDGGSVQDYFQGTAKFLGVLVLLHSHLVTKAENEAAAYAKDLQPEKIPILR